MKIIGGETFRLLTNDMCNGCVLTCPDKLYASPTATVVTMKVEAAAGDCPIKRCVITIQFLETMLRYKILSPEEAMEVRLS